MTAEAEDDELVVAALEEVPVVDAVAVAGVDAAVMFGPGPSVIMAPFPPGYVAPAAAVKSGGTCVSLLAKKYIAAAGTRPKLDWSKNWVRLKLDRFVALNPSKSEGKVKLSCWKNAYSR